MHLVPLYKCCTPIARNDGTCSILHPTEEHIARVDKIFFNLVWLTSLFSLWLAVKFSYLAVWVIIRCSFQILFSLCLSLVKVFGVCLVQQALSRWLLTTSSTVILSENFPQCRRFSGCFEHLTQSRLVAFLNVINIHRQKTGKREKTFTSGSIIL